MVAKNTTLIIVIVLLLALIAGAIVGIFLYPKMGGQQEPTRKSLKTYSLTLEDLYSNIKDSKRILKIKITVETMSEDTLKTLTEKQFLIRDQVNKILSNLTEDELRGNEAQIKLQEIIKTNLVDLFKDDSIINIYFNDFIIQ